MCQGINPFFNSFKARKSHDDGMTVVHFICGPTLLLSYAPKIHIILIWDVEIFQDVSFNLINIIFVVLGKMHQVEIWAGWGSFSIRSRDCRWLSPSIDSFKLNDDGARNSSSSFIFSVVVARDEYSEWDWEKYWKM